MLQWFYLIEFYLFITLITLVILNNQLANLIIIGEILIAFIFFFGLLIASICNLYYLIGVSFFVLIIAGIELSLNIMILMI